MASRPMTQEELKAIQIAARGLAEASAVAADSRCTWFSGELEKWADKLADAAARKRWITDEDLQTELES